MARRHTSTLEACFGVLIAVEIIELETKVQNYTLGKSCTNSWINYRIVVAYKTPIRDFVPPKCIYTLTTQGGSLMQAYIYAHSAKKIKWNTVHKFKVFLLHGNGMDRFQLKPPVNVMASESTCFF